VSSHHSPSSRAGETAGNNRARIKKAAIAGGNAILNFVVITNSLTDKSRPWQRLAIRKTSAATESGVYSLLFAGCAKSQLNNLAMG